MGSKKNRKYRKQPKFYSNRYTKLTAEQESHENAANVQMERADTPSGRMARPATCERSMQEEETPRCSKQLRLEAMQEGEGQPEGPTNYYIFTNFTALEEIVSQVGSCPECQQKVKIENILEKRMGYAHTLKLHCIECSWQSFHYTSKPVTFKKGKGRRFHEINLRAGIAFREIGKGHQGLENFCRIMNMHGMASNAFANIQEEMFQAYEKVAEASMARKAAELREKSDVKLDSDPSIALCQVSLDGSWQKQGHSSLNGLVTAICDGRCIDRHVMTKYCKGCKMWEAKTGSKEYDDWLLDHDCPVNHKKSSGAMEGAGALSIFCSSIEKHNLIYSHYIGDGDTSAFKEVVDAQPYKNFDVVPVKLECVGHIQKRLGTRLRELQKAYRNTRTPLTGKGKLTDKVLNTMQNYFGMAIRQNVGQLYQMKKAIAAILWHSTNFTDEAFRHRFCPRDENSWCKWQKDQISGKKTYKIKVNMPKWIHDLIKPIFEDLSSDKLLSKCLHGKTQNANESINNIIWQKCPKNNFVQKDTLQCGVNSAVIQFSEGPCGVHDVLKYFSIEPGFVTTRSSNKRAINRMRNIDSKASETGKRRRKKLRSIKKGYMDREKEQEGGPSYISGGHSQ